MKKLFLLFLTFCVLLCIFKGLRKGHFLDEFMSENIFIIATNTQIDTIDLNYIYTEQLGDITEFVFDEVPNPVHWYDYIPAMFMLWIAVLKWLGYFFLWLLEAILAPVMWFWKYIFQRNDLVWRFFFS